MRLRVGSYLLVTVVATLGCMLATPREMSAQITGTKGNKAVYSGTTTASIKGSSAYVDATAFQGTSNDICAIINAALGALPTTGGVVDARGIQNVTTLGNPLVCAADTTPWLKKSGSTYVFTTTPSDILLPAANICIVTPWIIPDKTRVLGAGEFGPYGTIITAYYGSEPTACSGTFGSTNFSDGNVPTGGSSTMFYMGYNGTPSGTPLYPSAPCPNTTCTNVAVKDMQLVGEALPTSSGTNGIYNSNSQTLSYVDQVEFSEIPGTGLVSSAPEARYTDLSASPNTSGVAGTLCLALVQPNGVPSGNGVSGVHGLSCTPPTQTTTQVTGMTSDGLSINNEDMHFEAATTNGLLIGANDASQANVVINVSGGEDIAYTTSPANCMLGASGCNPTGGVVHLSNAQNSTSANADVALLAIVSDCGGCTYQPTTILDDNTGDFLFNSANPKTKDTDRSVGLYVVGESYTRSPEFSRFTTSPSWQTWGVGTGAPPTAAVSVCAPGSLYSNTSASSSGPDTIYICMKSSATGTTQWYALK